MTSLSGMKRKYGTTKFETAAGKKVVLAPVGRKSSKRTFIKGQIKQGMRHELKFIDTSLSTGVFSTTGIVIPINLIAEGDDYSNRDGRQAKMVNVTIHGLATKGASVVPEKDRWLLVWDNATNGALPAISDILQAVDVNSFPNMNNKQRFTILRDCQNHTNANAATVDDPSFEIDYFHVLNAITQYNGTAAAITSIQNGALYFVTLGSAAATAATMIGNARVTFCDP